MDHLPTRSNLVVRHVIADDHQAMCVLCGIALEMVEHLFSCPFFRAGEGFVYKWIGIPFALPLDVVSFYLSHGDLCEAKKGKKFRHLIWHTTVWSIWLLHDEVIFNNGKVDFLGLTELIEFCNTLIFMLLYN